MAINCHGNPIQRGVKVPNSVLRETYRNLEILRKYLASDLLCVAEASRFIYQGLNRRAPMMPDHLIKNRQSLLLNDKKTINKLLLGTIEDALKFFFNSSSSDSIFIEKNSFSEWQSVITEIPPLLFLSFSIYKKLGKPNLDSNFDILIYQNNIKKFIGHSLLPSIKDDRLNDVINRNKLDDLHMHLNGTTEVELLWVNALYKPHKFSSTIRSAKNNLAVKELYGLEELEFNQDALLARLRIAKMLRSALLDCIFNGVEIKNNTIKEINQLAEFEGFSTSDYSLDLDSFTQVSSLKSSLPLVREALFLILVFSHLEESDSEMFSHCVYYYLLLKCQFMRLVVQQSHFYGFDQFQKITVNEIRSYVERDFEARFFQAQNDEQKDIDRLEGRFAPNPCLKTNKDRLSAILQGYTRFKAAQSDKKDVSTKNLLELLKIDNNSQGILNLSLIAHFIKKPDDRAIKLSNASIGELDSLNLGWCCRHYQLRNELEKTRRALISLRYQFNELPKYLKGFDAAANELDAGPEVFAPVFRRLRNSGYHNFTYHAGEDYVHLLSGIRAVDEAIRFLKLGNGNRIGHGTALGIDPALWRNRIGSRIVMRQGERLDDMVFAYHILKKVDCSGDKLHKIQSGISSLVSKIYCVNPPEDLLNNNIFSFEHITAEDLHEAWKLRHLDPILLFDLKSKCKHILRDDILAELNYIKEKKASNPRAIKLLERYHGIDDVNFIKKYNQLIEVDVDSCPIEQVFTKEVIRKLQKYILRTISEKQMAIESLPTSNLRISFYKNYSEHHIFNWLGVGDEEGMEVPVVLGSDDPGIFSTNLRNEYAHLLIELDKRLPQMESIQKLEQIVKNGKIWRFEN